MNSVTRFIFIVIGIDLVIALILFIILFSLDYFLMYIGPFLPNLGIGIISLFITGHILSPILTRAIDSVNRMAIPFGIISIAIVLLIGVVTGASVELLKDIFKSPNQDLLEAIFDWVVKPLIWIFLFGGIPVVISGSILGWLIKHRQPMKQA